MPLRSQVEQRLNIAPPTRTVQEVEPESEVKVLAVESTERNPRSGLIRVRDSGGNSYLVNQLGPTSTLGRISPSIITKGNGVISS